MAEESSSSEAVVVLQANDGTTVKVNRSTAILSVLVKNMVEEEEESETEVPLPNVSGPILKKVVEYLEYHKDNPAQEIERPLKTKIEDVICEWDKTYLEIDNNTLFELILAANYMDIKDLLDLTCAKVASMIKGKTPEEIREMFNIENDFTPEEEERIKEENKWCEDA